MNHASITEQALRYRNAMVADSFTAGRFDPVEASCIAMDCQDPAIDTAIRQIATAWLSAGLAPDRLTEVWVGADIDAVFHGNAALLDAMDNIIRAVHRAQFSRPRRRTASRAHSIRF